MSTAQDMAKFKGNLQNVVGKTAKIPDPKFNVAKVSADFAAARNDYNNHTSSLQSKILNLQNAASATKNSWKQYLDQLEVSNFGLSSSDSAGKAAIAKGIKYSDDVIKDYLSQIDTLIKNLDELEKHSMALSNYKAT